MTTVDPADDRFVDLVSPHWPAMVALAVRLCGRADGEDVAQDALAAAWRLRDRYDPARGTARAWLLTLTADQARRMARRRRARPQPGGPVADRAAAEEPGADLDLRAAITHLSERQELAVALFYYLDLPVDEVAAAMGCSAGTVKSTLFDARHRLRDLLEPQEDA